ncbi:MAG TPA: efflux RND transporter permease subunit [Gemmatimonadaceae bacterium]|nr:efflux RND transporter permease subunit [Gemmatimonadaceae bacterium]
MTFVRAAHHRAIAIYLLVAILVAAGIYEVRRLPSSIFPTVTFPTVKVIADAGEEPAARMMPTATRPLEDAILRVPGINLVRSITSRGSTEISAQFNWGTDMQIALQRVEAEVQRVRSDLPPDTRIDVEWMNTAVFPIQGYALTSKTETLAQLRQLAQYTLKPALIRIPGVSQVQVQGGRQREFEVVLDRSALAARHLAVSDVVAAIRQTNALLSAGLTERNHELYLTLVDGRVRTLQDLAHVAVPLPNGPPATLGQLGTVRVANEVSYVRTTANGRPAVLVNIVRQPSANTVAIARGVDQLFRSEPTLLPKDVQWTTFYDQARFVSDSVRGTLDAILIGVGLAALVMLVFLRDWRLMMIAVFTILVTVAIVGLVLALMGQTINLMTLAGVAAALGLIADDAVVVIENIERHQREGGVEHPAERGIAEIMSALVNSSLSTIVILVPFALLAGIVGAFFKPLALTMALSLVISLFVALIVAPVSISIFAPRGARRSADRQGARAAGAPVPDDAPPASLGAPRRAFTARALGAYNAITGFFIRHGAAAVVLAVVLIGVGYALYSRIGTDFLPDMDEGSIILDYWSPPGTSLDETDAMLRQAEKVIMSLPDVASYSRRTGTQLGFFITEPNTGDYVIKLKPRSERRSVDDVIDILRTRIAAVEPALQTDFGQLLEDNIGDLTGGEPQPVDIKVFGNDQAELQRTADRIAQVISAVPGVSDVFNGVVIAGPALNVRLDPVAAARYGLTAQSVQDAVAPAVTGVVADQVRVGDRLYDLRVLAPSEGSLGDIKIRTLAPAGGLVPLSTVASVTTGPPEAEIDRENLKSYVGVTARLSGRDLGGAVSDIKRAIAQHVQLGAGMTLVYGGLYQQQQQSFAELLYVLLAGLVLVSVVVLFEFADWRAPIVTSISAIAVLAGVFGALLLTGMTLNISSYVGAIMMVGIVGEKAIFVIHEAKLALEAGLPVEAAWSRAALRRLRPVAMTTLATTFALAPLALAIGEGSELLQPLAIAVIGGFVLSGPIALLVLPGLYRLLDPHGRLGRPATPMPGTKLADSGLDQDGSERAAPAWTV